MSSRPTLVCQLIYGVILHTACRPNFLDADVVLDRPKSLDRWVSHLGDVTDMQKEEGVYQCGFLRIFFCLNSPGFCSQNLGLLLIIPPLTCQLCCKTVVCLFQVLQNVAPYSIDDAKGQRDMACIYNTWMSQADCIHRVKVFSNLLTKKLYILAHQISKTFWTSMEFQFCYLNFTIRVEVYRKTCLQC